MEAERAPLLERERSEAKAPPKLEQFFERGEYETILLAVIVLNAASIGLQVDQPDLLPVLGWILLSAGFWLIFFVECVLKLYAYGRQRYFAQAWNVFDFVLTAVTFIEIAATFSVILQRHTVFEEMKDFLSGEFLQMLRLFRLMRLARLFAQLGILAKSFLASVQALAWLLLGSLVWFYINACLCTAFLGRSTSFAGDPELAELRERFETVGGSLFCLFEIMTLEGWTDYARPLLHKSPLWVMYFIVFIFISAFFLLNLVTAVVVDRTVSAQQAATQDQEAPLRQHKRRVVQATVDLLRERSQGQDRVLREDIVRWTRDATPRAGSDDSQLVESMALLLDHGGGEISLRELEELWLSHEAPLTTETFFRFHVNQAKHFEHQERLLGAMAQVIERMSGEKLPCSPERVFRRPP